VITHLDGLMKFGGKAIGLTALLLLFVFLVGSSPASFAAGSNIPPETLEAWGKLEWPYFKKELIKSNNTGPLKEYRRQLRKDPHAFYKSMGGIFVESVRNLNRRLEEEDQACLTRGTGDDLNIPGVEAYEFEHGHFTCMDEIARTDLCVYMAWRGLINRFVAADDPAIMFAKYSIKRYYAIEKHLKDCWRRKKAAAASGGKRGGAPHPPKPAGYLIRPEFGGVGHKKLVVGAPGLESGKTPKPLKPMGMVRAAGEGMSHMLAAIGKCKECAGLFNRYMKISMKMDDLDKSIKSLMAAKRVAAASMKEDERERLDEQRKRLKKKLESCLKRCEKKHKAARLAAGKKIEVPPLRGEKPALPGGAVHPAKPKGNAKPKAAAKPGVGGLLGEPGAVGPLGAFTEKELERYELKGEDLNPRYIRYHIVTGSGQAGYPHFDSPCIDKAFRRYMTTVCGKLPNSNDLQRKLSKLVAKMNDLADSFKRFQKRKKKGAAKFVKRKWNTLLEKYGKFLSDVDKNREDYANCRKKAEEKAREHCKKKNALPGTAHPGEKPKAAGQPGEGGLLALHKGRDVTASATRGIDKELNQGGEGGLLALHKGRDVTASATRGIDKELNQGGEGGLLALHKGRDVTASATREVDKELNQGGEGGLLALHKGRDVTASATREKTEKARIAGAIHAKDGKPIAGARASVTIGGKEYTGLSGAGGDYQIDIPPKVKFPGTLIITAGKKGYNTGSTSVGKGNLQHADIILAKASKDLIQIDASVHHLGDNNYGDAINSQFQKPDAEGTTYSKDFEIKPEQFPASNAPVRIILMVKGSQHQNPVLINGKRIGTLGISNSDGSASLVKIEFDICTLKSGKNTIQISSNVHEGDADDFEFANIQLDLKPAGKSSASGAGLAKLSSIRITDQSFQSALSSVAPDGYFWITAKGKSRCAVLKDVGKVVAYTQGTDASRGMQVTLTETGADTAIFHSGRVSVVKIGAGPGRKIIVRSGLRGASVMVKGARLRLEGTWEALEPGNHWSMRVHYDKARGKYVGILIKQGKLSKDVGFSLGEHVFSARPAEDWHAVSTTQKWRSGRNGRSESSEWRSAELDMKRSTNDRLVTKGGYVYVRVRSVPVPGKSKKAAATAKGNTSRRSSRAPAQPGASRGAGKPPAVARGGGKQGAKAATGGKAPGQVVIPVHGGSSRKHAGIPVKTAPVKKKPAKPVRWEAYKLQFYPSMHAGGLPKLEVIKVAFRRSANLAQLLVKSYPMSLVRDDRTGLILWSVEWNHGEVEDQRMSSDRAGMDDLEKMAEKMKAGSVAKSGLAAMIGRRLGPKARPLH